MRPFQLAAPSLETGEVASTASGTVYRETEFERTDLETIIGDLMSGQFNNPVRVGTFKALV